MDLPAEEIQLLNKFISEWMMNSRFELETVFGVSGTVEANTFLSIAQRLKSKGFAQIPQDDYLNIITKSGIRLTLQGLGVLQSYCKDNSLQSKRYSAMEKKQGIANNTLDIKEYNLRIKMREEEILSEEDPRLKQLIANWAKQDKAFRLIRRWSFEYKGVRIDMSMVRQSPIDPRTKQFRWSKTLLQYNFLNDTPRYEVEVELLRDPTFCDTSVNTLKTLIRGMGEVLRAIQKNTLLIRNSVKTSVLQAYQDLVKTDRFRGVGPVTLEMENIGVPEGTTPNIRIPNGYNVTDKADGLRAMGFVDKTGELFLLDQSMNVYRTGLRNDKCKNALLDGEWVTATKESEPINHYLLFDIYHYDGADCSSWPFIKYSDTEPDKIDNESNTRYNSIYQWYTNWKSIDSSTLMVAKGITATNCLNVYLKTFEIANKSHNIFTCSSAILDHAKIYHTDGLILTSNFESIPSKPGVRFPQQFKWKPAKENTVDFLLVFEKDYTEPTLDSVKKVIHPDNERIIQFKTARLYVGGAKNAVDENPRDAVLNEIPIMSERNSVTKYKPILFTPIDFSDTMANICYLEITMGNVEADQLDDQVFTHDTKEPITSQSIVEMRYEPQNQPGWRWIPTRIRHDKTERLLRAKAHGGEIKYTGMMNDENVANSVWRSIHNPITTHMIRTGAAMPHEDEIKGEAVNDPLIGKKYYDRKAPKQDIQIVRGLLDFHNNIIKKDTLIRAGLIHGKKLIDFAAGKGGDLYKWHTHHADMVIGIDIAGDNITNSTDGAYKRYTQMIRRHGAPQIMKALFIIADSSKRIMNGNAGANPQEADFLRSIFGGSVHAQLPKYVERHFSGALVKGADVGACMFAIHYFFETKDTLNGFLTNLVDSIRMGGYFIGCCFDGRQIFNLLNMTKKGNSITRSEGNVPIWSITKEYNNEDLEDTQDAVGLPINVEFISIGAAHREYLVNFNYLTSKLAEKGFHLLEKKELQQIGLKYSTQLFSDTFKELSEAEKKKYNMSAVVKEFSFLNRWFIYKREENTAVPPIVIEEEVKDVGDVEEVKDIPLINPMTSAVFGKKITKENPEYTKFVIGKASEYSVLKPWHIAQVDEAFMKWFPQKDAIQYIVDGTAHVGVDSWHFSNYFEKAIVHSYEVVPLYFAMLEVNIKTLGKTGKIIPHFGDISQWNPEETVDILFVDPPWGSNFETKTNMDLYLQAEDEAPDESKNVINLIQKWIDSKMIINIILKTPSNYNYDGLQTQFNYEKVIIKSRSKKADKIAFTLLLIRNTDVKPRSVEEVKENQSDVVPLPINVVPSNVPKKKIAVITTYKSGMMFRFGITGKLIDSLGINDPYAVRYLSLSIPFPISDQTDPAIMYPTIEHYIMAMKIKYTSNNPEAYKELSNTSKLHQDFLASRIKKKIVIQTDEDYKYIYNETKAIKTLLENLASRGIKFNEDKWPSVAKKHLEYALELRFKEDNRFHAIVEKVREKKLYMLYMSEIENEVLGMILVDKDIRGKNLVGITLMEIAGFEF